ncbi:MAG: hypothetical protein A2Y62_15010 [Candidatus Fischerbacteria bacterium RBG_13_37_8]|uniref:Cyclodeaminase/cyclohydrolase domain-containing protein n=1 Tax=Candidatus Fischerbacteria bacterium RBG_13_37_8 TaxID=1817863 RepID=A0A1F5V4P2_9BACT|nr:MAG: hypothetical protein A2Y62_15010 [Candidatus Fischerbacteria bacterium RBG_13_37_8]
MFIKNTIEEFLTTLASEQPTPGGGSVAGLANCLSASLLLMFCKLSIKNTNDEDKELFTKLLAETKDVMEHAKILIDKDADAFDNVIDAFKLPKITDTEKQLRTEKIQDAFYHAALVPLENIKISSDLLEITEEISSKGNQNALSDFKCAIYLAKAAYQCARENVLINLESIKNQEKKNHILQELHIFEKKL